MNFYISMTTVPPRINIIKKILENFYINQTYKPHKIILNIPLKYKRFEIDIEFENSVTDILKSIILKDLLIVNRCYDYGSATKLLPTLLYFNENKLNSQNIIIIDDDIEYVNDLIETIYNLTKNNINNVYCFTGYNLKSKPFRHPNFEYNNLLNKNQKSFVKVDIFGGVNGVYLNSDFFKSDIFDIINHSDFIKDVYLLADDDFISLYLYNKIDIIYINKQTFKKIHEESNNKKYCLHLDTKQIERQEQCINYMLKISKK
jgi:hypothetical protein